MVPSITAASKSNTQSALSTDTALGIGIFLMTAAAAIICFLLVKTVQSRPRDVVLDRDLEDDDGEPPPELVADILSSAGTDTGIHDETLRLLEGESRQNTNFGGVSW